MQRKAITWGRFSSDKQSEGDSRERQDRLNRAIAAQRNIRIVAEHFDEGVSVKDGATPVFKKVVSELPKDVGIICENFDRISRNHPWRAKSYIADILEAGHFIITSQDGREYNSDTIEDLDTLVLGDMATNLARSENNKRKLRVNEAKDANISLARQGKPAPLGAWLPAYLTYSFETKTYLVNTFKRSIVERIFTEYLNGKGCGNIARGLNKDRIPNFKVKKRKVFWIGGVISQILRSECYVGTLTFNGERIPQAFPRAVSDQVFYKVQGMFAFNKTRHGNYSSERVNNILRGVCRCAKCNNAMRVYIGDGETLRIQCGGYRVGKCDQRNMAQFAAMEYEFAKWFIPRARESLLGKDSTSSRIDTLEAQRKALQIKIENTLTLLDSGFAVNEVSARLAKLEGERSQVDNELSDAKAKQTSSVAHPDTFKELDRLLKGIRTDQTVRRKVSALIPSIVKCVKIDLSDKMFPSFTCELTNGEIIKWQYSPDVIYGYHRKQSDGTVKIVEVPEGGSYEKRTI